MGIGARLRQLRHDRRMSAREVAEQINVPTVTVLAYEKELTFPSIERLKTLAQFYNVSSDYLLYGNPTTDEEKINRLVTQLPNEWQDFLGQLKRDEVRMLFYEVKELESEDVEDILKIVKKLKK